MASYASPLSSSSSSSVHSATSVSSRQGSSSKHADESSQEATTTTKGWNICTSGGWSRHLSSPTAWSLDETPLEAVRSGFTYGGTLSVSRIIAYCDKKYCSPLCLPSHVPHCSAGGNGSYYYSNDNGTTWSFSDGKGNKVKNVVSSRSSPANDE